MRAANHIPVLRKHKMWTSLLSGKFDFVPEVAAILSNPNGPVGRR